MVGEASEAMPQSPWVSVIIPAYNGSSTIGRTLDSVSQQSWRNLEIIVVDDGSTDDTAAIVTAYSTQDPRVRLLQIPNGGVAGARNAGIAAATHELIAPVDADDLWHPRKIEQQVKAWEETGRKAALVYCWFVVIDENDFVIYRGSRNMHSGDVLQRMCLGNMIGNGSTPMMLKSVVLEAGGYDPGLRAQGAQGCEDLKLYIAIAEKYHYAVAPHYLAGYRETPQSMSSDGMRMLRSYDLVMQPMAQRHPEYAAEFRQGRIYLTQWLLEKAAFYGTYPQLKTMFAEHCRPSARLYLPGLMLVAKMVRKRFIRRPRRLHFRDLQDSAL